MAVDIGIRHHHYALVREQGWEQFAYIADHNTATVLNIYIVFHNISTLNSRTKVVHFCDFY